MISNPTIAQRPETRIQLMIAGRRVCAPIFCEHWCISRPTLDRYVRLVKDGHREMPAKVKDERKPRESIKKDFIIVWFVQYAMEVTERLPDCPLVLLPRLEWKDMHSMYEDDMSAAGYRSNAIAGVDHFRTTFKTADELAHMQLTKFKRNFSKCSDCVELTAAVSNALKAHDARRLERAKAARLEHYLMARSDKVHYWQQRTQV